MSIEGVVEKYVNESITVSDEKTFEELKKVSKKSGIAIPLKIKVKFRIAQEDETIESLEGKETAKKGGVIITGTVGEEYAIAPDKFPKKYENIRYTDKDETEGTATKIVDNKEYEYLDPMTKFQAKTWAGVIRGDSNDILVRYGEGDYGIIKKKINGKNFFETLYKTKG